MPDPPLQNYVTPFHLLFSRKPHTHLDALVPQEDGGVENRGLSTFVERQAPAVRRVGRQRAREKQNEETKRPARGIEVKKGDLVLVRKTGSSLRSEGLGPKLVNEE